MAKVIAVGNLKGGVGKSTLAINLACELATGGRRVALIDADDQGTATEWAAAGGLPISFQALPLEGERRAEAWIRQVTATEADYIVIDLPPHTGAATAAALILADLLVIPATPSVVDLRATAKALEMLSEARKERGDGKPACVLVPSKVDRRTGAGREIEGALHEFGERVAPAIGLRSAFVDSAAAGAWVGSYAPRSIAHTEIQAVAGVVKRVLK